MEVAGKPLPDADAWIVLDRTEMAYTGDGEIRTRKLRLAKILTERGMNEANYWLRGLGGKASKVNKLKGWNLRPDNELVKLDDDLVLTSGTSGSDQVSTKIVTIAVLPRAAKGSWIAFESQETFRFPTGPSCSVFLMEDRPIHRWELVAAKKEGWFTNLKTVSVQMDSLNFQPWLRNVEIQPGQSLCVTDVPAVPEDEGAYPHAIDVLPRVLVRFSDPDLKDVPSTQSWDRLGQYYFNAYLAKYSTKSEMGIQDRDPEKVLRAIHGWMTRELTYKQVYLAPERGSIPEHAAETVRKRYGDCKDLATCFISEVRNAGLSAYPVLARIVEGRAKATDPVSPGTFNHAILAVKIEKTLGLAAEIETSKGRYLLIDPTDRLAPFGFLPAGHRDREVLLCLDSGGLWCRIPADAVKTPRTRVTLMGEVTAPGRLDGTMIFEEDADALGLRQACLDRGPQKMREFLLETLLDIPPTGSLEIVKVGNPLDVERPFEITFKFSHPDGFHLQVGEGLLASFGLPGVPNPIQKPGKPRQFPVEWMGAGIREYEASIRLPWCAAPVLPTFSIRTPFRSVEWAAKALPDGNRSTLKLSFRQERQDACFDFSEREKGLYEWKKDRSQFKTLLNDGLAFKLNPL